MKATHSNLVVDIAGFIAFLVLASSGFVLRLLLPHGSGGLEGGMGYRALERPVVLLWGFAREEWGTLHFWCSIILLVILLGHLALHWRWILHMFRGRKSDSSGLRLGLGLIALGLLLMMAFSPFLFPTETVTRRELWEKREAASSEPGFSELGQPRRQGWRGQLVGETNNEHRR